MIGKYLCSNDIHLEIQCVSHSLYRVFSYYLMILSQGACQTAIRNVRRGRWVDEWTEQKYNGYEIEHKKMGDLFTFIVRNNQIAGAASSEQKTLNYESAKMSCYRFSKRETVEQIHHT